MLLHSLARIHAAPSVCLSVSPCSERHLQDGHQAMQPPVLRLHLSDSGGEIVAGCGTVVADGFGVVVMFPEPDPPELDPPDPDPPDPDPPVPPDPDDPDPPDPLDPDPPFRPLGPVDTPPVGENEMRRKEEMMNKKCFRRK